MNTHTNLGRRLVAALGAAAVGLVGLAGVASAGPISTPPTADGAPTTGSLTIHKFAGSETVEGNGTEQTVSETGLNGVTFTIRQVTKVGGTTVDLKTAAGWNLIQGIDSDVTNVVAESGYTLGERTSVVTGAAGTTGVAYFGNLPIGVYLVQETNDPDNVVSAVEPFLVTIPLWTEATGSASAGWNYSVHAYPKNTTSSGSTKTVSAPDKSLAGSVTWTVSQPLPKLNSTDSLTKVEISDPLDSRLSYVEGSAKVSVDGVTFAESDYTITYATTPTNKLTVVFNSGGLSKLTSVGRSGSLNVKLTFDTQVTGLGTITNEATTYVNSATYESSATTNWGGIKITKKDASVSQKVLKGAEFALYDTDPTANSVSSISTGTTDVYGELSFGPLYAGDGTSGKTYWLVETSAPDGYVLDPTPVAVTVMADASGNYTVKSVTNTKAEVPSLPLTGANGELLMTAGGIALVLLAGGGALIVRSKRRQS